MGERMGYQTDLWDASLVHVGGRLGQIREVSDWKLRVSLIRRQRMRRREKVQTNEAGICCMDLCKKKEKIGIKRGLFAGPEFYVGRYLYDFMCL